MKHPTLFDVPADQPSRHMRFKAWKEANGVWTHFAEMGEGCDNWMALAFETAKKALEDYELTAEEKTEPMMLMAGYCRLIDEAGLCAEADSEWAACELLAKQLKITFL